MVQVGFEIKQSDHVVRWSPTVAKHWITASSPFSPSAMHQNFFKNQFWVRSTSLVQCSRVWPISTDPWLVWSSLLVRPNWAINGPFGAWASVQKIPARHGLLLLDHINMDWAYSRNLEFLASQPGPLAIPKWKGLDFKDLEIFFSISLCWIGKGGEFYKTLTQFLPGIERRKISTFWISTCTFRWKAVFCLAISFRSPRVDREGPMMDSWRWKFY